MNIFIYDGTFEGLLSAVFYAYDTKVYPNTISGSDLFQDDFFAEKFTIYTNDEYAKRVWGGLEKKCSKLVCQKVYRTFLSGLPGSEMLIFNYIKLCFNSSSDIDTDYSNDTVLELNKTYLKVNKEAHRAVMFIRFQKTRDGIYYAPFEPAYNVLPLTIQHFKDRFSDQQWLIYDTKRNYGFHYNLEDVSEITISNSQVNPFNGKINEEVMDATELDFQELWSDYFQATTIKERKNLKVHKQFLPRRFWKYLPEKNFRLNHEIQ